MSLRKILWLLIVFAVLGGIGEVFSQTKIPQFKNYAVTDFYKGKNAPLIISSKDEKMFRTRLREASKETPNFAGRYILTTWGCGTTCLSGALIDAKTGKVYRLPHSICCWGFNTDDNFEPVEFRLNSRLIIFSGLRNESEKDSEDDSHFYEFKNGRFIFIKTVKRKSS